jgi:hypothetical protein
MAAAKKSKSTAVVKWDEELARQAEAAAAVESNAGGGQMFSTKGGILSWNDAPMPDNQMAVVILDTIFENVYYEEEYDPNSPSAPTCYAYAHEEKELKPIQLVVDSGNAQNDVCKGCEHNEFGTANKGKGKACRNGRRLALLPAGFFRNGKLELYEDPDHWASAGIGFLKIPPTSIRPYAGFVKTSAATLRRPPHGLITKIRLDKDPNNQFNVVFEALENVPDEVMGTVMARREEALALIEFPYPTLDDEDKKPKGKRTVKSAPAKKTRKY